MEQKVRCLPKDPLNVRISYLHKRFWAGVKIREGKDACWMWQKSTKGKPRYYETSSYGQISCVKIIIEEGQTAKRRKKMKWLNPTHRVAWFLTYGMIPRGMFVLHKCDNPACVRPTHLFLGTQKENMQDCMEKGRWNAFGKGNFGYHFSRRSNGSMRVRLRPINTYRGKNNARISNICR